MNNLLKVWYHMENAFFVEFPTMDIEDLHVNNFGYSVTKPCHKFGPAVRNFYLIHYILDGEGEFFVNNNCYKLKKGQGFLIEPDYQTVYMSDATNPWTYVWVGFSGKKATEILNNIGICQDFPIFTCEEGQHPEKYVKDMLEHNNASSGDTYRQMAMLYLFFSCLTKSNKDNSAFNSNDNVYIMHAIRYIQNHYSEPLKIEEIAKYVGLNRSYLSTLFKKYTGLSPLKYLQTFRMTKAAHLLSMTQLSIASIAFSCGYQEPESFHKVFRQTTGLSPSQYRIQEQSKSDDNRHKSDLFPFAKSNLSEL